MSKIGTSAYNILDTPHRLVASKTTKKTTALEIWPFQILTYRYHNCLAKCFSLLTRTLVSQTKAWVPHPVYVGSYLTESPHMNPFQLIGNMSCILVVLSAQPEKCIYKVNGMNIKVKDTCHHQHSYYFVSVHYWGIGVNWPYESSLQEIYHHTESFLIIYKGPIGHSISPEIPCAQKDLRDTR